MIDYLLLNSNLSIQYRVKTEVLNQELSFEEKNHLQEKVLKEPIIQSAAPVLPGLVMMIPLT